MALELRFINVATGELFDFSELNLSEREVKWCSEYQEWDDVRRICQQNMLPLGVKQAYRQMDYIARDFAWSQMQRGLVCSIYTEEFRAKR